jgi:glyoxylase-like metal-dependent hydrolase (beta-lactamase superfamily II)
LLLINAQTTVTKRLAITDQQRSHMIFRQLFDQSSWTYTYLLADPETGDAVIIDPVFEKVDRDALLIQELELNLRYTLETHVHADHVTGSGALRERLGAQTVVSALSGAACADVKSRDGDRLTFGRYELEVMATPGHTDGCLTFVVRDGGRVFAFTGDAIFVRGCGRTDFQQGDARTLYRSVHGRIYELPEHTFIYPGHDYRGHLVTTVREEKQHNPRLNSLVSEDEFVDIMSRLKLADPKLMDVAVPANLACGVRGGPVQ